MELLMYDTRRVHVFANRSPVRRARFKRIDCVGSVHRRKKFDIIQF